MPPTAELGRVALVVPPAGLRRAPAWGRTRSFAELMNGEVIFDSDPIGDTARQVRGSAETFSQSISGHRPLRPAMRPLRLAWPLLAAVAATACTAPGRPASLELTGFLDAGGGYHYEAWLDLDGGPVSIHQFDGTEDRIEFEIEDETLESADSARFFVTLEVDGVSGPSAHEIVESTSNRYSGVQEVQSDALPLQPWYDLSCCKPDYQVATPTTATEEDEAFGLWLLRFDNELYRSIGSQWVYEGWVVTPQGRFSTGRFFDGGSDHDGAGPSAGPEPGYDVPGQDFIDPPMSLLGAHIEITIEPEPDNSPDPFVFARWGADIGPDWRTGPSETYSFPFDFDVRQPKAVLTVDAEEE